MPNENHVNLCRHSQLGLFCLYAAIFCLLFNADVMRAATYRYVSLDGTNDAAGGYTNWAGAATNIQDAVNVATNGDTVWVSNGTYYCSGVSTGYHVNPDTSKSVTNTAMIVITNAITLKSWGGTFSNTVISGNYPTWTTRVVLVYNTGAILDGLTISNGWIFTSSSGSGGAGIYFRGSLITNCLITHNYISNSASFIHGVAVSMDTAGKISHCVINKNRNLAANDIAITLCVNNGPYIVSNCVFTGNGQANFLGKTLWMYTSTNPNRLTLIDCKFYGNDSEAGASFLSGRFDITSCIFSNNSKSGLHFSNPTTAGSIRNCLIVGNGNRGIQIAASGAGSLMKFAIENCTIANNYSYGVYIGDDTYSVGTNLSIYNSVVYYNSGNTNWKYGVVNAVYSNCCTYPMPTNQPGLPVGAGNTTNPPFFVDTNTANYRLSPNSPCINSGVILSWMTNSVDLDGLSRIRYGMVDMGAYETMYKGMVYGFR